MVLVIDDDAQMRALLRDFLTREGFRVEEHGGGEALITDLESVRPAAIVLDKEMPGISGLDLLVYITRRYPEVPVIVITAFGGARIQEEALRRGATQYVEKPFRVAHLAEALRAAIERRTALAPGGI